MDFLCSKMKILGSKMDFGHADGHVTGSRTGSRGRSCSKMDFCVVKWNVVTWMVTWTVT